MSFIKRFLEKTGLDLLFKPSIDDEKERQQTLDSINHFLLSIIEKVDSDIETEKTGFYPHPENSQALNATADSLGYIQYIINDEVGRRLQVSEFSLVACNSIKMTENFQRLKSHLNNAGYQIELKEISIDGDGVQVFKQIDEYNEDFERYFVITISGWL
ncbi:MAG: hypothetical protein RQ982_05725 [Gammaproteobacteria bacterium]|nr:hypothetical protein [Gammaproteobacteria bacterium]